LIVLFQFSNGSEPFNVSAQNGSGYWNVTLDLERLTEGLQNMTVFANDSANNMKNTELVHFTIDVTAPGVTFVTPPNASNYSLSSFNQTFNVSVLETNFVNLVLFSFDNASAIQ
jgi:hypothetical protein